jgi:hypothetical protein
MKGQAIMFFQLRPYLCALVSLYLMFSFAQDIRDYHKLQTEEGLKLEREERIRQETLSRLRSLIHLEEKEDIDGSNKKRWIELSRRLRITDF